MTRHQPSSKQPGCLANLLFAASEVIYGVRSSRYLRHQGIYDNQKEDKFVGFREVVHATSVELSHLKSLFTSHNQEPPEQLMMAASSGEAALCCKKSTKNGHLPRDPVLILLAHMQDFYQIQALVSMHRRGTGTGVKVCVAGVTSDVPSLLQCGTTIAQEALAASRKLKRARTLPAPEIWPPAVPPIAGPLVATTGVQAEEAGPVPQEVQETPLVHWDPYTPLSPGLGLDVLLAAPTPPLAPGDYPVDIQVCTLGELAPPLPEFGGLHSCVL